MAIPTVIGVTILVFFMIHMVPGDPAVAILGPRATPARIAVLHHQWGLDRPLVRQYMLFMGRTLRGNLGQSFFYQLPARTLIAGRIGCTLLQGSMLVGGDSHDHLTGSTAGNTAKAVLSDRHGPRLGPHCSDLCPHVFRRSAQRSDPELVSGTQIGGYGASGNEISNTDLLSCSRSSAVPRTSAVRATGNWRASPPGSPFLCSLRRFPCVGTRRTLRWSRSSASKHCDNGRCGQAVCPSRAG